MRTPNTLRSLTITAITAFCLSGYAVAQSDQAQNGDQTTRSISSTDNSLATSKPSVLLTTSGANSDIQPLAAFYYDRSRDAAIEGERSATIYRVGVADLISIRLNGIDASPKDLLVRRDGTIEYALVGDFVPVAGKTVNEIAALLTKSVRLVADPQLEVTVKAFNSHSVEVKGDVERPGIRYLRREAVPLYVLRAEAIADPSVKIAVVRREDNGQEISVKLGTVSGDGFLVFPNSIVEFKCAENPGHTQHFKLLRQGAAPQTHDLREGTTLLAAISFGNPINTVKKVLIRRTANDGKTSVLTYKPESIVSGKVSDPLIFDGDVIELQ